MGQRLSLKVHQRPPTGSGSGDALDAIQIAMPCPAAWESMTPLAGAAQRVRHCAQCDLNVYNLSEMPREEALALLARHEGERLCVRLYRRGDGTVITQDCSRLRQLTGTAIDAGRRGARQVGWVIAASFAAVLAGFTAAMSGTPRGDALPPGRSPSAVQMSGFNFPWRNPAPRVRSLMERLGLRPQPPVLMMGAPAMLQGAMAMPQQVQGDLVPVPLPSQQRLEFVLEEPAQPPL